MFSFYYPLFLISIHALREEGDLVPRVVLRALPDISIHALREEGDMLHDICSPFFTAISIHALREEGDIRTVFVFFRPVQFLSTPSARRATMQCVVNFVEFFQFLSTPSARRATAVRGKFRRVFPISIHALREEGDFQAPPPKKPGLDISIHALREEGDVHRCL